MGQLPAARVTVSHPFSSTGVDYAGPFLIKLFADQTSRMQNWKEVNIWSSTVYFCDFLLS